MALVVKDRVKEVTTTTGTSNLTLGGAVYGFQSFSVIGNGNTTYYGIYDAATGDWEVGVGTYSTTGPTLTRDTVLESSNSGSKVVFGSGSKDVFVTYPAERAVYLDAAGSAVPVLDIGTLGVSTANITTANITAGTISTTPTASNDLVNKTYVDGIAAQGISYHEPVKYEVPNTTGNLNALYNNGASGVGATLTNNGTKAAFAPDGPTASVGDRVLIYNQTNAYENGVYEVSVVGTPDPGGTNWVLTRTADADSYGTKDPNALGSGDAFFVTSGNTGAGETYVCNTAGTITFGTTAITFAQISSAQVYSAGTGLTLSNLVFSITPVGTANTYGSASSVPVFTTNASGQVTSVTNTAISIGAGAVTGLAPSATTDTTNASNITSGTLGSARLAGSYTGITGVGTLTAGTWTATAIGAAYGGTGQTSYAVGDLLYADTTTSLAKLADVVTGNALISGGVGTAPAWGKIGLQTHVSGTLQLTNGGTGATDATGARSNLGLVIGTNIPSVTGSGASGTWGINITGNAATATTATTSTTATSVSNSVTFNNSGSGAASGNGFNGSSALTVSYNTIGAPSTTGANASGTWGISITGSSASTTGNAATATALQTARNINAVSFNGTADITIPRVRAIDDRTAAPADGTSQYATFGFGSWNNNNTAPYADFWLMRSYSDSSGGSDNMVMFRKDALGLRVWQQTYGSATAFSTFKDVAWTDGTNASGTWGISITGNAATATNGLTTSNYVSYSTFTGAVTSGGNNGFRNDVYYSGVRNPIWSFGNATSYGLSYFQGASGLGGIDTIGLHPNGTATGSGSVLMVTSSYTQSLGSLRAPIFYDSDNTGYYVDPTGSTSLRTVGDWRSNSDAWTGEFAGKIQYHASNWYFQYASQWIFRNSGGTNVAYGDTSGNMWAEASMRSPIFYDANNTGYYVDPASTTYLHTLILSGASYFRPNNWIQFDSTYGLYWPNNYGAHFHANDLSTYTQLAARGSKNSYGGFYDQYSAVNGVMYDSGGNGGPYREANGRWYFYYNLSNDCMGIGTSSTSSTYSLYLNKGVYAQSRIDATIFYDTNNTGYYCDPNSTNRLNYVLADSVYSYGNVTAYSDERLKADWAELPDDFIERLANLKSGTYTRIDTKERQVGVGAQGLQEFLPEAVSEKEEFLGVNYGNAALAACVELAKSVVALRAEINALRAQ